MAVTRKTKPRLSDRLYRSYIEGLPEKRLTLESEKTLRAQSKHWQGLYGAFLPQDPSSAILDLGCGNGSFVWWLQQHGFIRANGVDRDSRQIQAGQSLGIRGLATGDAFSFLSKTKGDWNCIILRDFLEHFPKEEVVELLDLCFRALRSGGTLIVQVPNAQSPFFGGLFYGDFTHQCAFTESSLHQVLQLTGFDLRQTKGVEPAPRFGLAFLRFLLWKGVRAVYGFLVAVESGPSKRIFSQNLVGLSVKRSQK